MKYFLNEYRFGTVKDGKLDYGVYEISSKEYSVAGASLDELKLKSEVARGRLDYHYVSRQLYQSIPGQIINDLCVSYNKMIRCCGTADQIDLITVEFEDVIFVRYCALGQWFAFGEKTRLSLEDQTKWGNKINYFSIWDGWNWVKPGEYDVEPHFTPAGMNSVP